MRTGVLLSEDSSGLHPEEYPFENDLKAQVHKDGSHKQHLRNEHSVDFDGRFKETMILEREDDTKSHLTDTNKNGEFHLHRVQEGQLVFSQIPNGVHTEGVRAKMMLVTEIWRDFSVSFFAGMLRFVEPNLDGVVFVRVQPGTAENVEGLGKQVIVDKTGVDGEDAHQKDDVSTTKEHSEDLISDLSGF